MEKKSEARVTQRIPGTRDASLGGTVFSDAIGCGSAPSQTSAAGGRSRESTGSLLSSLVCSPCCDLSCRVFSPATIASPTGTSRQGGNASDSGYGSAAERGAGILQGRSLHWRAHRFCSPSLLWPLPLRSFPTLAFARASQPALALSPSSPRLRALCSPLSLLSLSLSLRPLLHRAALLCSPFLISRSPSDPAPPRLPNGSPRAHHTQAAIERSADTSRGGECDSGSGGHRGAQETKQPDRDWSCACCILFLLVSCGRVLCGGGLLSHRLPRCSLGLSIQHPHSRGAVTAAPDSYRAAHGGHG